MAAIKPYEKNGKTYYMFQLYIGTDPLTGKVRKTTRRGFKTKKEAQLELARLQLEIDKGTYVRPPAETYREVYDLWVVQYENTVEESTFMKTLSIFKNHVLPQLGDYKIDKINIKICEQAINHWFRKFARYRMVKAYASKVLDYAIKLELIQTNPMKLVTMPTKRVDPTEDEEELNFYTKEELLHFLKCMEEENNFKAYTLFRILAFSGMRKGEALALTWEDINFKDCDIRINKALSRGKDNRLYVKTTKTKSSRRTLKMDERTMEILADWRKKQKQDYLILGFNTLQPKQLVFSSRENGLMQPTKTRKWMLHVQQKYGLKEITTHGLRHTHCSLLFEAGATIKEVQDRLGHGDVQTTMNIYAHVTKKVKAETIQKFVDYLDF